MANCVTCGDALHPERAERYSYCTKPECQERNAQGLEIAAIGVNKAADQYVVLDERIKQEMASGRFKKQPEVPATLRDPSRSHAVRTPASRPSPSSSPTSARPRWSETQQNLALIYHDMGMRPGQIAGKLGISPYLATQILLAATARRGR